MILMYGWRRAPMLIRGDSLKGCFVGLLCLLILAYFWCLFCLCCSSVCLIFSVSCIISTSLFSTPVFCLFALAMSHFLRYVCVVKHCLFVYICINILVKEGGGLKEKRILTASQKHVLNVGVNMGRPCCSLTGRTSRSKQRQLASSDTAFRFNTLPYTIRQ